MRSGRVLKTTIPDYQEVGSVLVTRISCYHEAGSVLATTVTVTTRSGSVLATIFPGNHEVWERISSYNTVLLRGLVTTLPGLHHCVIGMTLGQLNTQASVHCGPQ